MKKFFRTILPLSLFAMTLASCGESAVTDTATDQGGSADSSVPAPTHDYDLKIWAAENAKALTEKQAKRWADAVKASDGVDIGITVEAVGEGDAAGNMTTDPESGADLYCFAQDQLSRLKNAGALQTIIDAQAKADLIANNDEQSVSAVTVGDSIVAYPLTSDNGFFMYYDKSVFPDESKLANMEDIIEVCREAGKKIYFQLTTSAWYSASYFMAFDCFSTWSTNKQGQFYDYSDNYNSKAGEKALKAAYNLLKEKTIFVNNASASTGFTADKDGVRSAAVVISGTWDYAAAVAALGDNLGARELPSVTINGETKHLASFMGCKLMGVKPQTDSTKGIYAEVLAEYLTGEECQLERFNELGWGPSNRNAQQNENVKTNIALNALSAQNEHAVAQGQYPGDWWTSAAAIFENLEASDGSDASIKAILTKYESTVDTYINGLPDEA